MNPDSGSPDIKPMKNRKFDILLVGATGVTGGLITKYISRNALQITWAIAGRSEEKMIKLLENLPTDAEINKPDIVVIDVLNDPESKLRAIIEDTRVVIDVVGPYSYWGEKVLKPCVEAGTTWVDLNGEVPWARDMIIKYQSLAEDTKAVVVPCCGYDCVPSDLGVYLLSQFTGGKLGKVDTVVEEAVGLASFGTLSSLLAPYDTYSSDMILRPNGYIGNPYYLYPQGGQDPKTLPDQPTKITVKRASPNMVYHAPLKHTGVESPKQWGGYLISSTPFEAINRPVVLRSYGLRSSVDEQGKRAHDSYGVDFKYREWHLLPTGVFGRLFSMPTAYILGTAFPYCLSYSAVRGMLRFFFRKVLGPGYGPSPELQERGGFRWRFIGEVVDHKPVNERAVLEMEGKKDVGYGWTSIIMSEIALHLVDKLRSEDGTISTPAGGFGANAEELKSLVEEGEKRVDDDVVFGRRSGEERNGGFWTTACLGMGLARRLLSSGYLDVQLKWVVDDEVPAEDKKTV